MTRSFRQLVLRRKAVVYVRQSTPQQVQSNLESQRRQYELVDVARRRGFTNVEIIDDDLADLRVVLSTDQVSIDWSRLCAPGRSVLSTSILGAAQHANVAAAQSILNWVAPARKG